MTIDVEIVIPGRVAFRSRSISTLFPIEVALVRMMKYLDWKKEAAHVVRHTVIPGNTFARVLILTT